MCYFLQNDFINISLKCPNVQKFTLETDFTDNYAYEICPLITRWRNTLTHLTVPGEGNTFDEDIESNDTIITTIAQHSHNLMVSHLPI